MPVKEVRELLINNGFKIFSGETENGVIHSPESICDENEPCEFYRNNALAYIYFQDEITGATISTGSVDYKLYTASFSELPSIEQP